MNGSTGHIHYINEGEDMIAMVDANAYRSGPQFRIFFEDGDAECAVILTPRMALDLSEAALAFAKRHGVTP